MGHSYTLVTFWGLIISIFEGKLSLWDRISKLWDLRGKSGLFLDIGPDRKHWMNILQEFHCSFICCYTFAPLAVAHPPAPTVGRTISQPLAQISARNHEMTNEIL